MVAAMSDGCPVGMCVGSFTSVSLAPPLVGFLTDRASTTWPLILRARTFAVSVLGHDHADLARVFAAKGADRFRAVSWQPGWGGCPLISGAVLTVECDIADVNPAGDHWFVTGSVRRLASADSGGPLVFYSGGFIPLPAEKRPG